MHKSIQAIFLFLVLIIGFNACSAQTTAKGFVACFKIVVDNGDVSRFLPGLVVSKSELKDFLEADWKRKSGKSKRRSMKKEFDRSVNKGWNELNKKEGIWISNELINKQYEFEPLIQNLTFYDIKTDKSKEARKGFGEVATGDITVISAKYKVGGYPDVEFQISFPCVKTKKGKWKMIYRLNIRDT
jgi:hypothetical protein